MLTEAMMPARRHEEKVRINRILMLDEAIRSGSCPSIPKLARKAEVNERTIERDIEYLRDIYRAPIERWGLRNWRGG
jgi:predicted DNA-binding transcriptional regulator YafY